MTGRLASLAYHLAPDESGSLHVVWEGPSDHTAESLLDSHSEGPRRLAQPRTSFARSWPTGRSRPASSRPKRARPASAGTRCAGPAGRSASVPARTATRAPGSGVLLPPLWDSPHCPLSPLREG